LAAIARIIPAGEAMQMRDLTTGPKRRATVLNRLVGINQLRTYDTHIVAEAAFGSLAPISA
jgi:hypothetical protein